jgi:uncharacterized protein (DUF433 family)
MDSLSTNEVVALFELDERRVRKEVEHGVFGPRNPPRFDLPAIVYLRTVVEIGFEMGAVEDRKRLYHLILDAMKATRPTIELSPITVLHIGRVARPIEEKSARFEAWKKKLVIDDRILGGEPVFPESRLSVRNVGAMLLRGISPDDIREDYPYLSSEDIEFARLYALAYPRMGRPRERQAPPR